MKFCRKVECYLICSLFFIWSVFILQLKDLYLLDYSVICPNPPVIGAVVVVDPFSSGANLAALAAQWGYRVILVFSEMDSPVTKMVRGEIWFLRRKQ